MTAIRIYSAAATLFWLAALVAVGLYAGGDGVAAQPMATAVPVTVEPCVHISTADTIKIYRCLDPDTGFEFYANQLGFLLAPP